MSESDLARMHGHVLGLVSGLPRSQRERCLLIMLQVFADDSGSSPDESHFVLGGLVADVGQWLAFSDDWKDELDRDGLTYFKASEANAMRGQFEKGWNRRLVDQKTDKLADIVVKHVQYRVHVILKWSDFNQYIKSAATEFAVLGPEFLNPYFICFYALGARFARFVADNRLSEDREFVFDEQGKLGENAASIVRGVQSANKIIGNGFGGIPSFRDDKKVRPLQGADLFAWNARDYAARGGVVPANNISIKRSLFAIPPAVSWVLNRDRLLDMRADILAGGIMMEAIYREHGLEPPRNPRRH